ncbi:hypothetical protein BDY24DRAFT_394032 [Mrakia frigida]|uniref:Lcl2p n=1 Tax=Mrakia frigida TaxID=29902 RepID=UPI003FCC0E9E
MFNQQHQQQQQQQQQQADASRNRGWQAQKEIPCNQYLCPQSFACVEYPSHCPCPYPEDRKCFLPLAPGEAQHDASFVCQRGPPEKGCEEVRKRAMGRW